MAGNPISANSLVGTDDFGEYVIVGINNKGSYGSDGYAKFYINCDDKDKEVDIPKGISAILMRAGNKLRFKMSDRCGCCSVHYKRSYEWKPGENEWYLFEDLKKLASNNGGGKLPVVTLSGRKHYYISKAYCYNSMDISDTLSTSFPDFVGDSSPPTPSDCTSGSAVSLNTVKYLNMGLYISSGLLMSLGLWFILSRRSSLSILIGILFIIISILPIVYKKNIDDMLT